MGTFKQKFVSYIRPYIDDKHDWFYELMCEFSHDIYGVYEAISELKKKKTDQDKEKLPILIEISKEQLKEAPDYSLPLYFFVLEEMSKRGKVMNDDQIRWSLRALVFGKETMSKKTKKNYREKLKEAKEAYKNAFKKYELKKNQRLKK